MASETARRDAATLRRCDVACLLALAPCWPAIMFRCETGHSDMSSGWKGRMERMERYVRRRGA